MNKFKRALAAVVALTLAFSLLLTGCGDKGTKQAESSGAKTAAQTATVTEEPKLEQVELIWYYPGSYPLKDQDEVFAEANKMISEKINATVKFMATNWGEYEDKMKVIMASDEPYDLSFTSNWINNYTMAVSKGAYQPLDELLIKYAPKLYASIPEKFWGATKVNGKIYGIINYQICARAPMMGLAQEYGDKIGLNDDTIKSAVNNLEALEPYLQSLKEKLPDIVPINIEWESIPEYYALETIAGAKIPGAISLKDDSLIVFNQFDSPQFKQYIEMKKKWEDKGYLHGKELISLKDLESLRSQNKIAIGIGGTYKPGGKEEEDSKRGRKSYGGIAISDAYVTTGGIIATMHAINRDSKNPERAMMLMELINTDVPLYNMIAWGREGKDYNKVEDGFIEPIKDAGYNPGTLWLHASTFNAYVLKGQPKDVWEQTRKLNESAMVSPALGFTFNPDAVKNEIAQCSSVVDEYLKGFNFGILSLEKDYPKFLEKLDKAGAKAIVSEMQKQIDEWKKTK